jgi:hypothetical protein
VKIPPSNTVLTLTLFSAFIHALSDLLNNRNAIAIIATHSPVVIQELPSSCVWQVYRTGSAVSLQRTELETFGENVGVLTREIFGLEAVKSGFHDLLAKLVINGGSYEEILLSKQDSKLAGRNWKARQPTIQNVRQLVNSIQ